MNEEKQGDRMHEEPARGAHTHGSGPRDERGRGALGGLGEGLRTGVGVLNAFREVIEETVGEAMERGDISPDRARAVVRDAVGRVQGTFDQTRDRLDFASRRDLDALREEVAALREQIQSLQAQAGRGAASGAATGPGTTPAAGSASGTGPAGTGSASETGAGSGSGDRPGPGTGESDIIIVPE